MTKVEDLLRVLQQFDPYNKLQVRVQGIKLTAGCIIDAYRDGKITVKHNPERKVLTIIGKN